MAAPQIAPLPELFELTGGMQIVVTALDPTTGALVANVNITSAYADVEYVSDEELPPLSVTNPTGAYLPGEGVAA